MSCVSSLWGHYLALCASWAGVDMIIILIIDPEAKVLGVVGGNERMRMNE